MGPTESAFSVTALAAIIANCFDDDELSLLAAELMQLADTIETILVKREICEKRKEKENKDLCKDNQ